MKRYVVEVNGNTIEYGADVKRSGFSNEEWSALCHEMVKQRDEEEYQKLLRLDNQEAIIGWGNYIDMAERYEYLLELLPQSSFSKAGTHPEWVAKEVDDNTLNKGIIQDDVATIIESNRGIELMRLRLEDYFDLDEAYYEERQYLKELLDNANYGRNNNEWFI